MKHINPAWKQAQLDKIASKLPIDELSAYLQATNWLIIQLVKHNIPYKVYNLGGSVKRVTTETTTCPCCKKLLV